MSLTTGTAEGRGSLGSAFHKTSACKSLALMRQLPWAGQNEPLGFIKGTDRCGAHRGAREIELSPGGSLGPGRDSCVPLSSETNQGDLRYLR